MKVIKIVLSILLIAILSLAWLAPIGPMPGLFIGGAAAEVPNTWGDTRDIHEIKLEVPGRLPRVVIIWVVQVNDTLHVVGSKASGWVKMLGTDNAVRMRLSDKTYSLQANLVNSGWEPVLEAYQDKYRKDYPDIINSFPPLDEAIKTTSVYRLTAR